MCVNSCSGSHAPPHEHSRDSALLRRACVPVQVSKTGCVGRYHTANLNNYLYATNGGTGPAYSNMCVGVFEKNDTAPDEKGAWG